MVGPPPRPTSKHHHKEGQGLNLGIDRGHRSPSKELGSPRAHGRTRQWWGHLT